MWENVEVHLAEQGVIVQSRLNWLSLGTIPVVKNATNF